VKRGASSAWAPGKNKGSEATAVDLRKARRVWWEEIFILDYEKKKGKKMAGKRMESNERATGMEGKD